MLARTKSAASLEPVSAAGSLWCGCILIGTVGMGTCPIAAPCSGLHTMHTQCFAALWPQGPPCLQAFDLLLWLQQLITIFLPIKLLHYEKPCFNGKKKNKVLSQIQFFPALCHSPRSGVCHRAMRFTVSSPLFSTLFSPLLLSLLLPLKHILFTGLAFIRAVFKGLAGFWRCSALAYGDTQAPAGLCCSRMGCECCWGPSRDAEVWGGCRSLTV